MDGSNHRSSCWCALAVSALILLLTRPVLATEPPLLPPADWGPTAIDYSNVPYPYPVSYLEVQLYGDVQRMAYMDVLPSASANGQTVVLLHGMNFFAAAFRPTIAALSAAGFRVIAIDRLGYGRSSTPTCTTTCTCPPATRKHSSMHSDSGL